MALEKTVKTTLFQRFKRLVLGKERPNLLTRISVIIGFVGWLYLFSWHMITFLSLILLGNLKQSKDIRPAYQALGQKYGFVDTISALKIYSLVQVIIYCIILFGLILIWRKKKLGFLFYVSTFILSLLTTYFMMGFQYMKHEIPIFDFILIGSSILYFSIGLFWFYRKRETLE